MATPRWQPKVQRRVRVAAGVARTVAATGAGRCAPPASPYLGHLARELAVGPTPTLLLSAIFLLL